MSRVIIISHVPCSQCVKPAVAVTFALGEQRYVTVAGYLIHNSIEEGMRAAPYTCPCRYSNGYASLLI